MFIKNKIKKDFLYRKTYKTTEIPLNLHKIISNNKILTTKLRESEYRKLENTFATETKIRNRCLKTGRARGIVTQYKQSRQNFKNTINNREMAGLRSASW